MTSNIGPIIGGIEGGGTKFICGIADRDSGHILETCRVDTEAPAKTLGEVVRFFEEATARHGSLAAVGLGCFGPLSLNPQAADYGSITATAKAGWSHTALVKPLREALGISVALDTDVNCAALAEHLFGNGRGLDTLCYATVGTGIGVGVIVGGLPHGGANHPEAGHMLVPRADGDRDFAGICPFHTDCLEGLASGPAIAARWGRPAQMLPADHPAWAVEADYLGTLCLNLTYVLRPDRIILGGGVMQPTHMAAMVRQAFVRKLGGYDASISALDPEAYIVSPSLDGNAGLYGALALGSRSLTGHWPFEWANNIAVRDMLFIE